MVLAWNEEAECELARLGVRARGTSVAGPSEGAWLLRLLPPITERLWLRRIVQAQ